MSDLLERLYAQLPSNYQHEDQFQRHQLKRFLSILVDGGLKGVQEDAYSILKLIDVNQVPAKYLPYMAHALGFSFPYDLDEQTQRTYIKNAVISYKMKGTKKALLFMIRELTRFTVEADIDEANKNLTITLYVDPNRQDLEKMRDKVAFLIQEYCPPMRNVEVINSFVWDETYSHLHFQDELIATLVLDFSSYEEVGFFLLNQGNDTIMNDAEFNLSNFEQYPHYKIEYDSLFTHVMPLEELDLDLTFTEWFPEIATTVSIVPLNLSLPTPYTYVIQNFKITQNATNQMGFTIGRTTLTNTIPNNRLSGNVERVEAEDIKKEMVGDLRFYYEEPNETIATGNGEEELQINISAQNTYGTYTNTLELSSVAQLIDESPATDQFFIGNSPLGTGVKLSGGRVDTYDVDTNAYKKYGIIENGNNRNNYHDEYEDRIIYVNSSNQIGGNEDE